LLSMRRPNVLVEEASALPLPALLRHMSVVVSLASGASAEAAAFGVPSLFLSEEARGAFAGLIERGLAGIVDVHALKDEISRMARTPKRPPSVLAPSVDETLRRLESIASEYSRLCRPEAAQVSSIGLP
jgi:hypothetical protein